MTENLERRIIELIATDRIDVPISSMSGKLKRQKPKLAKNIDLSEHEGKFEGERVYARIEEGEGMKARGMREAVEEFKKQYPRYGKILEGMIEEKRVSREVYLYFGMNPGCRLTTDDYMDVMINLGFSEATAKRLYPELMEISRKLRKRREESERSIMI